MASAKQKKAPFIACKLKFLKDQGELLIGAVGQYVSRIISTGETWTEGGDNNMDYSELCQMIETAVEFLSEKCEELADSSVSVAANQFSRLSCQQPDLASQSTTAATSAAPLASAATTSRRQTTEPVQRADETDRKSILARIAVIEEALCSFRSKSENVAEQQSGIDQQLKDILSKLSESDKKHKSRFRKVKEQISEINETQITLDQEQETRLQSLEKQLQKLSAAQDIMKAEMESQGEPTEKLIRVLDELESVKENFDVLDARIGRNIDDCSHKHQDIATVTRDLADKIKTNTDAVHVISEGQDQKTTFLRELETKIETLEADSGRKIEDVQKQAEKGETNFRILCQMLHDRLTPLEQLRTCFSQQSSMRNENIKKLTQVIQEVAFMWPRLQQLELKSSRPCLAFTARASFMGDVVTEEDIIEDYTTQFSNAGQNFDADNGVFTVPVDGLFVISISLWLAENEFVEVGVNHIQGLCDISDSIVCTSSAAVKDTTTSDMTVVFMNAGDKLFTFVNRADENCYERQVYFSCFLLK